jgi:hypothetical protein
LKEFPENYVHVPFYVGFFKTAGLVLAAAGGAYLLFGRNGVVLVGGLYYGLCVGCKLFIISFCIVKELTLIGLNENLYRVML